MKLSAIAAMLSVGVVLPPAVPVMAQAPTGVRGDYVSVQPPGQWLASHFIGQSVTNAAGETIGDINDLLFDKSGRIANVVIGIGGFLGIGQRDVAVPFASLSITAAADGKRVLQLDVSKEALQAAPAFAPTEKTTYLRAKEQAVEMGHKAADKARELSKEAGRKIEEMRKDHKAD